MSATYDIETVVGQVRLMIGDTDVHPDTDAVFTNEELEYFLTAQSNSVPLAAADALEAWAAKYAANADTEKIGDYSYAQKTVANMLALAKRLRDTVKDTEDSVPVSIWAEMDLTAGSAITVEED